MDTTNNHADTDKLLMDCQMPLLVSIDLTDQQLVNGLNSLTEYR